MVISYRNSMELTSALLPAEPRAKPIPSGTKVRIRWDVNKAGKSERNPLAGFTGLLPSASSQQAIGKIPSEMAGVNDHLLDSQLVVLRSRGSGFDRVPLIKFGIGQELLSGGILLISISGFILLFVVGFCLIRMFRREEGGRNSSTHRNRELQIVLVPKQRRQSSLIHPHAGSTEKPSSPSGAVQLIPPKGQKPFPRRIYELQAEEGYFSCPPSMRASFEID